MKCRNFFCCDFETDSETKCNFGEVTVECCDHRKAFNQFLKRRILFPGEWKEFKKDLHGRLIDTH